MSLWLVLGLLLVFSALFLAVPLVSIAPTRGSRSMSSTAALNALLNDINRAEAMGDIDAQSAETERTAIKRQLLQAAPGSSDTSTPQKKRIDGLTGISVLAVVVLGAVALYAVILAPTPSRQDLQSGTMPASPSLQAVAPKKLLPDVDTMITRLADRMRKNPNDLEGWRMLGWSYFETQHFPQSVDAYAHAVALKPDNPGLQSAYGEALTQASAGKVTPAAATAFRATLSIDPKDERARYYMALSQKDAGQARAALETWIVELNDVAPTSLWSARLRAQILATARELNIDVNARLPAPPSVPSSDFATLPATSAQQMASLSPQEQQQMIANMVEGLDQRLAANPKDAEGWVRLIRSRKVLGQMDLARAALARALAAFNGDAQTQARIKTAAGALGVTME
jgi:cytochrome c-type biogenesis protein CcmH